MSVQDVPPKVLDYLDSHDTLTLATASPAGVPHAATMVYANDGLAINLWSRPTTTPRNTSQNSAVSFTVDEYAADWTKSRGIQGSGEMQRLTDPASIDQAAGLFAKMFPPLGQPSTDGLAFVRISPTRLSFIDNESQPPPADAGRQALGMEYRHQLVFDLFRELPQRDAELLVTRLQPVQVAAGEVIVSQGGPADEFFIVVDGAVDVVREDGAQPRTVATLGSGQFFGEMAILHDMPRVATVRAVRPTTLLVMGQQEFRDLVAQLLAATQDFDKVVRQRADALAGDDRDAAGSTRSST